ncbi:hypothetical protein [uncultured Parasutterella sp.]|uniref:hypothetical protein n=1 Tax=uncultured Parasutterella sp. TaxID=1263098 RepID=UPI002595E626|nr:hypothetical protein [uncultured Parasutterella sp.]
MNKLIAANHLQFCDTCGQSFDDPLSLLQKVFLKQVAPDRFGILNAECPINFAEFHDEVVANDLNLEDIAKERAQELASQNKVIHLGVSGGVDSTLILSVLLPLVDPEKLVLYCHPSARAANPKLFELLKQMGRDWEEVDDVNGYKNKLSDCLSVVGNGADIFYGPNSISVVPEKYHSPWVEGLKFFFRVYGVYVSDSDFDRLVAMCEVYADRLGVKLNEFCELAWLQNFGLAWVHVMNENVLSVSNQAAKECAVNFFDTPKFQGWALGRFNKIATLSPWEKPVDYKPEMKAVIKSLLGLDMTAYPKYFMPYPSGFLRSIKVLTDDGTYVYRLKDGGTLRSLNSQVLTRYLKDDE